jgi:methanethiol S-methyltransferase
MDRTIIIASAWIAWCAIHSMLIAPFWMRWMRRMLGERLAYYRLCYDLFSAASLVPLSLLERRMPGELLFAWSFPLSLIQWTMLSAGLALMVAGGRQYNQRYFFGLQQIADARAGRVEQPAVFKAEGILRRVRHPYYTAGILIVVFLGDITTVTIATKAVLVLYFIVGTLLEERKLVAEFGETYRAYQREVPMLVPRLVLKR